MKASEKDSEPQSQSDRDKSEVQREDPGWGGGAHEDHPNPGWGLLST